MISYLELWWPLRSLERNHLCNFGRGYYGKHSCEIILNLNRWFREEMSFKKRFTDDGRTDDGRRPITISHIEPSAHVS